jgi:hypothetical protein
MGGVVLNYEMQQAGADGSEVPVCTGIRPFGGKHRRWGSPFTKDAAGATITHGSFDFYCKKCPRHEEVKIERLILLVYQTGGSWSSDAVVRI